MCNISEVQYLSALPLRPAPSMLSSVFWCREAFFPSIIVTNGNPECLKVTLNSTSAAHQTRVTLLKKKISDLLRLKRSGSHKWGNLDSGLLGIACERSLRGFSHQNVWMRKWKGQDLLAGCALLNSNHCAPPSAICSFLFSVVRVQTPGGRRRLES